MKGSPIITVIYDFTVGLVTDWLEGKAMEEISERQKSNASAFDYIDDDLAELEDAVDDYDTAYTAARLAAHDLADNDFRKRDPQVACVEVQRSPEIDKIDAALKELRKLNKHSETVISATIMRSAAREQIQQDALKQHRQNRDMLRSTDHPPRPFDRNGVSFLARMAGNQAAGRSKMVARAKADSSGAMEKAAEIENRLSTLMGRLQYLKENMERDSGMFVALDERICDRYRLHSEGGP